MSTFWNERYAQQNYAYGKQPNAFFKSIIDPLSPGRILVPAAGEGRDAVYAATLGWSVDAFDLSEEGKKKALALANEFHVTLRYTIMNAQEFIPIPEYYDGVVLTFVHLPQAVRHALYRNIIASLKPNGIVSIETFSPAQLQYSSGGPKEIDLLQTSEMLRAEFSSLEVLQCYDTETDLDEGEFHKGKAAVARFVGKKKL